MTGDQAPAEQAPDTGQDLPAGAPAWWCGECGSAWAPGAPCCPACRSTHHTEGDMPNIHPDGSVSYEPGHEPAGWTPPASQGDDQVPSGTSQASDASQALDGDASSSAGDDASQAAGDDSSKAKTPAKPAAKTAPKPAPKGAGS